MRPAHSGPICPPTNYRLITAEFFGGLGLILGLFTRVASFGIFSDMVVAAMMVHRHLDFFMN